MPSDPHACHSKVSFEPSRSLFSRSLSHLILYRVLECFPNPERIQGDFRVELVTATMCPENPEGDPCELHRICFTFVDGMACNGESGFYFSGRILDVKVVQSMAIIMVQSWKADMPTLVSSSCSGVEHTEGPAGSAGYLYFFQSTPFFREPKFLFRSLSPVAFDLSRPVGCQWSLTASKMVYREGHNKLVEVPLYWSRHWSEKCRNYLHEETECLALGYHGDLYTSLGHRLRRQTSMALKKRTRMRLAQNLEHLLM